MAVTSHMHRRRHSIEADAPKTDLTRRSHLLARRRAQPARAAPPRPVRRARPSPAARPWLLRALLPAPQLEWRTRSACALQRVPGTDLFGCSTAGARRAASRSCTGGRPRQAPAQRHRPLLLRAPAVGDLDLHLFGEGRHRHAYRMLGAHRARVDGVARRALRRLGAQRRARQRGRRFQRLGRPPPPDARAAAPAASGSCSSPAWRRARSTSSRSAAAHSGDVAAEDRPLRPAVRAAPAHRLDRRGASRLRLAATSEWMARRARARLAARAAVDLRGAPRLLAAAARTASFLDYRELAHAAVPTMCSDLGFTHIELLPITEHPLDDSWGYQTTGYFAPTSRFGTPDDFRYFVDHCHQHGIGVILDWVPAHFPRDAHGLARFDGTRALRARRPAPGRAPRLGHADLQLRPQRGAQLPALQRLLLARGVPHRRPARRRGGLDALPRLLAQGTATGCPTTTAAARTWRPSTSCASSTRSRTAQHPGTLTHRRGIHRLAAGHAARPDVGGLGFSHEVEHGLDARHAGLLRAATRSTASYHHDQLTFGMLYAFTENFILPLSHDEVVHGKRSLLGKMPGDDWQQLRQPAPAVRLPCGPIPGKKLLFMGGEFGAAARVETTTGAATGTCWSSADTAACSSWCAT